MTERAPAAPRGGDRLRRAAYLAGLALGGGLLVYQAWRGVTALAELGWQGLDPAWLAAAGGLSLIGVGLQMLGWLSLSNGIGTRLTVRQATEGYFVSFLPRYIPGLVWGYLGRGEWLFQNYGIPYALSSYGSTVEIVAVLTSNVLTLAACLALTTAEAPAGWAVLVAWIAGLLAPGWLIGRIFALRPDSGMAAPAGWARISRGWMGGVIAFQMVWLCYGASTAAIFSALGLGDHVNVFSITAAFCLAWLAGFVLIFVPAGLGIRESVLANLILPIGGLLSEQASLVAVTSRLLIVLSEVLWVVVGSLARVIGKY